MTLGLVLLGAGLLGATGTAQGDAHPVRATGASTPAGETAPSAPTISHLSGVDGKPGLSTDPDSFAGAVGATQERLTLTTGPASRGYSYAISPARSVDFPSDLRCNTSVSGFTTVCPGRGVSRTLTITAPSDISTFAAETFDAAGDVSPTSSVAFYAVGDHAATAAGHSWLIGAGTGTSHDCETGPVPDSAGTAKPGLQYVSDHHACWEHSAVAPSDTGSPPSFGFHGDGIVYLDGRPSRSGTSTVIDPAHNLTVGAWVRPAVSTGSSYVGAVLSETVHRTSVFSLGVADGTYRFCLTRAGGGRACAASAVGSATAGRWTFVTGVYDISDGLLLLYVSADDFVPTPVVASYVGVTPSGPPTDIEVGDDALPGAHPSYWNGEILDPFIFPGVADTGQLSQLADLTPPVDLAAGS